MEDVPLLSNVIGLDQSIIKLLNTYVKIFSNYIWHM